MRLIKPFKLLVLLGAMMVCTAHSHATELRGRVDGRHPYAPYPFPVGGAMVGLYMLSPQGPRLITNVYTGSDGMYYFSRILPGVYTLQVNGVLNFPLTVYPTPQQDIPPILIR